MNANAIELVCKEIVELVTEYLGGTLAAQDRVRFDQHLATCPPCTARARRRAGRSRGTGG
jgi:anti-sigma factor RsiW